MRRLWIGMFAVLVLALAGCGDDDGGGGDVAAEQAAEEDADAPNSAGNEAADDPASSSSGSVGGTLVMGDETLTIDSMTCYLEEQPRAGLGGVFEWTAQGRAVNAAGEDVLLDVSRARPESGPTDDAVIIDIGDPFAGEAISYRGGGREAVTLDGQTLTASGLSPRWSTSARARWAGCRGRSRQRCRPTTGTPRSTVT